MIGVVEERKGDSKFLGCPNVALTLDYTQFTHRSSHSSLLVGDPHSEAIRTSLFVENIMQNKWIVTEKV